MTNSIKNFGHAIVLGKKNTYFAFDETCHKNKINFKGRHE
jgi:hypothetical protein